MQWTPVFSSFSLHLKILNKLEVNAVLLMHDTLFTGCKSYGKSDFLKQRYPITHVDNVSGRMRLCTHHFLCNFPETHRSARRSFIPVFWGPSLQIQQKKTLLWHVANILKLKLFTPGNNLHINHSFACPPPSILLRWPFIAISLVNAPS